MMLLHHLRAAAGSLTRRLGLTIQMVMVLGIGVGIFMVTRVSAEAETRIERPDYRGVYRLMAKGAEPRAEAGFVWYQLSRILFTRAETDRLRPLGDLVATYRSSLPARGESGTFERVQLRVTTRALFAVFERRFVDGAPWPPAADDDAQLRQVVITESLARRWFARVGGTLDLDGERFTIAGVIADDPLQPYDVRFTPEHEQLFVPWAQGAALALESDLAAPDGGFVNLSAAGDIHRLREAARLVPCADFWHLARQRDPGVLVYNLLGLFALAGCTFNLARLLLARFYTHSAPASIRRALGARRSDIFVLHLLEALLLAVPAALIGLAVTAAGTQLMNTFVPTRPVDYLVDTQVVLFELGVTLAAALVAGLWPAVEASRVKPATQLRHV
jgi:putative ABC transport system permease protein